MSRHDATSSGPIDPIALGILAATPAMIGELLAALPEDAALEPRDEGWSAKHVLAHLLDAEGIAFNERLDRIGAEDSPYIRSIDPPARLHDLGYLERPLPELLAELIRRRRESVARLRAAAPARLARTGEHDHAGTISASDIVHQWAYHDLMHLKQIFAMLEPSLVARMGNTRRFYDV